MVVYDAQTLAIRGYCPTWDGDELDTSLSKSYMALCGRKLVLSFNGTMQPMEVDGSMQPRPLGPPIYAPQAPGVGEFAKVAVNDVYFAGSVTVVGAMEIYRWDTRQHVHSVDLGWSWLNCFLGPGNTAPYVDPTDDPPCVVLVWTRRGSRTHST